MNLWLPVIVVVWSCCVQSDACSTPNGQPGQCQSILDCSLLWDVAVKPQVTKEEVYHLRKSACGFNGSTPLICCPEKWEVKKCVPTPSPPDPRSHCCGVAAPVGDKLEEGKLPDVDQFPWMGIIEFQRDSKGNIRNAVLISGRYAISVAQCFTSNFVRLYGSPTNLRFREFGRDCEKDHGDDCKEAFFKIPILRVLVHHQYNESNQLNDIALLRLLVATPYTDVIRPICLPTQDFTIGDQKDLKLVTAGWKSPVLGMAKHNPIMRYFDAPHYLEAAVCAAVSTNVTKEKRTLGDHQLCATIKNREDCSIDIGGPLILYSKIDSYAELAGITSFTMCKGMPDVYTKVFEYRSWILDNISID